MVLIGRQITRRPSGSRGLGESSAPVSGCSWLCCTPGCSMRLVRRVLPRGTAPAKAGSPSTRSSTGRRPWSWSRPRRPSPAAAPSCTGRSVLAGGPGPTRRHDRRTRHRQRQVPRQRMRRVARLSGTSRLRSDPETRLHDPNGGTTGCRAGHRDCGEAAASSLATDARYPPQCTGAAAGGRGDGRPGIRVHPSAI